MQVWSLYNVFWGVLSRSDMDVACSLWLQLTIVRFYFYYFWLYSKTSLNRTLLFQKVIRFSKISVYTKCRIAPANRTNFGLGGGFSDVSDRSSKQSEVRISARAVERGDASKWTCKPNTKARKLQTNPNIVQIAPRLTEICSVYMKARRLIRSLFG